MDHSKHFWQSMFIFMFDTIETNPIVPRTPSGTELNNPQSLGSHYQVGYLETNQEQGIA